MDMLYPAEHMIFSHGILGSRPGALTTLEISQPWVSGRDDKPDDYIPPRRQTIGEICPRCGAVLTMERLYTCSDKDCPYPDFPGRE
ncbi:MULTISPECIES: hypothetical protein [unclassified Bradyrhizobium]|uniref:hypothetical protein n=1 Tax=unclassified Bradyrhizobium TaxID=2631580 RepID=UPI002916D42A|nr:MULTISPECIES: hypothetical protein [unclassified Bradyrhizobium]